MTDVSVLSASEAVRFLEWLDPTGLHNLVAIDPVTKGVSAETFDFCSDKTLALDWILQRNGKANLYFSINAPKTDARPDTKLRRDEIGQVRAFHVDIDNLEGEPDWDMDCLPSAVIDSGGGRWGFWKLDTPIPVEDVTAIEAQNRALTGRFHGDTQAHNLDRIARLPGTLNIPNEAKRKKGRVEAIAKVLALSKLTYSPAEVAEWCPPAAVSQAGVDRTQAGVDLGIELDAPDAVAKAIRYLLDAAPEAVEGEGGDESTYRMFARLKDFGISQQQAPKLAADFWNDTKAIPPWNYPDLVDKCRNAYRHGTAAPGRDSPALAESEFEAVEGAAEAPDIFEVQSLADFRWNEHRDYLVKYFINRGQCGVLAAPPNAGKSPLALDMAASIALGEPWQGQRVKQGYVLYYATEGDTGIPARMEALVRARGIDKSKAALDFRVGRLLLGHVNADKTRKDTKMLIETVNQRGRHFGVAPGLVIIDTYSHSISGSDSSDEVARVWIGNAKQVARETGAAVLVLAHPAKDRAVILRGSDILVNDLDFVFHIDHDKKSDIRTLQMPRGKDYRAGSELRFRCGSMELGKDQDGDPITAPFVEWLDATTEFSPLPEEETLVLAALETVFVGREASGGKPFARFGEGLEAYINAKNAKYGENGTVPYTENQHKKRYGTALKKLIDFGPIRREGEGKQTQYLRSE
jgi:hypothetical protein